MRRVSWLTEGQRHFSQCWELLRDYFGLRVKEPADVSRRRVLDQLAALPVSEQLSPVLLELLGLADPLQAAIKLDPKDTKNAVARFCKNPAAVTSDTYYGCYHRRFALDRRGKRRVH